MLLLLYFVTPSLKITNLLSPLVNIHCRGQSAEDAEWDKVEKERELKKAEVERARQELETRRRIEARLRAKQEAEAKTKGERREGRR